MPASTDVPPSNGASVPLYAYRDALIFPYNFEVFLTPRGTVACYSHETSLCICMQEEVCGIYPQVSYTHL